MTGIQTVAVCLAVLVIFALWGIARAIDNAAAKITGAIYNQWKTL